MTDIRVKNPAPKSDRVSVTVTLTPDIAAKLQEIPHGRKSAFVDRACRREFEVREEK